VDREKKIFIVLVERRQAKYERVGFQDIEVVVPCLVLILKLNLAHSQASLVLREERALFQSTRKKNNLWKKKGPFSKICVIV
jgi:hypothetical protein